LAAADIDMETEGSRRERKQAEVKADNGVQFKKNTPRYSS